MQKMGIHRNKIMEEIGGTGVVLRRIAGLAKRHGGRIVYYGCVALVLGAIAYGAERYRGEEAPPADALILPAAEIEIAEIAEPEPMFELAPGMTLLTGYSAAPRWDRTLGMWQTHMAADYLCPESAVRSLSGGTVRTVGKSGIYGGFVEIETGEYLLRYASVSPEADLAPGMEIDMGQVIARADDSMPGEAHLDAHLHIELYKMDKNIDFEAELAKKPVIGD